MKTLFPTISPPRLRGQLAVSAPPTVGIAPGAETRAQLTAGAHIARSVQPSPGARSGPMVSGSPLEVLQRSVASFIKGAATGPGLYSRDGHPIHLDAEAHDLAHHGMSSADHREAGEALRQAAKLLFHIRDVKRDGGDKKGALLFDREARGMLARTDGHTRIAAHKDAMNGHAEHAAAHGAKAAELAREITGGKDHIGIQDHARARAHPQFPEYVAERHAELRASDGVRHAALGAMGHEKSGAHPVELNRFLAQHGHDEHGLSEEPESSSALEYDPDKARLDKGFPRAGGKLATAFVLSTLRRSSERAPTGPLEKTITGAPSIQPVKAAPIAAMAARGGRARNLGRAQERIPTPPTSPRSDGGDRARDRLSKSIDALRKGADLAATHMQHAADAGEQGDTEAMLVHAIQAMEHALGAEKPAQGEKTSADPATGAGNASRDGDGDGRVDGPDDGDSDEDRSDPHARPAVLKALQRRPLRPGLDVINHRPKLRVSTNHPATTRRIFRRWPDGSLDSEGALHTILDVLWKLRDGAELTPVERAIVSVVLPADDARMPAGLAELTVKQLSPDEKRQLAAMVLGHLKQIARADRQRALARSASALTLPQVRKHLPELLARDPFRVGTATVIKAYAPVEIGGARDGAGSRGGKVAYTTKTGRPVYASHARRLAPHMDRAMTSWHQRADSSNDPEHHAVAAKHALGAAFYHHHSDDPIAADQALDYADHHYGKAQALGHKGRTMRWIEQHHQATRALLGHAAPPPPAPSSSAAQQLARSLWALRGA